MTDFQKFFWTVIFDGLYLITGIRAYNWVTSQINGLNTVMQFLALPFITLALAAPGNFFIFQILKRR